MTDPQGSRREPATSEEMWSLVREVQEMQRESARRHQETDQVLKEINQILKESARGHREMDQMLTRQAAEAAQRSKEADRRMNKLDEQFNGHWGRLMEALVEGDLIALLRDRGIDVDQVWSNAKGRIGDRNWELDLVAVNGEEVVVVEVKTTLKVWDVNHFLDKLGEIVEMVPQYADRTVYGAVAYLKADESSAIHAERRGLFVIRATGSSASIVNRKDFEPRAFGDRAAVGH